MINYNNKKFEVVSSSINSETTSNTVFVYKQIGNIVTCTYKGDTIIEGHLLGLVADGGTINIRYHQINIKGKLTTGICTSTPKINAEGSLTLHESWQWTSGDKSSGSSILQEISL